MRFLLNNYGYEGIIKALVDRGHEVLGQDGTIDSFNWWQYLMNEKKSNEEYDKILRAQIEEHKPDVYLCGKGWHFDKFIKPETTEWIHERVKCSIYWSLDDPDFLPTFKKLRMQRGYDIALTCCGESIPEYRLLGLETHLFWPAWDQVAREEIFVNEEDRSAGFLIVGTPYTVTRIQRRNVAVAIMAADIPLTLYGPKEWLKAPVPGGIAGGYPTLEPYYQGYWKRWDTVHHLFASAKINFVNHLHHAHMYLNDRVPMVLGTGGFLLCDRIPGLEQFFHDGEDLVYYDDLEDLLAKTMYYLERPLLRERIALNGQARIRSAHTYERRVEKLLSILCNRGLV